MGRGGKLTQRLRRLAKSKAGAGHGALVLPTYAREVHETSPLGYATRYFKSKTRAPFLSPYARDYQFVTEQWFVVRVPSRDRYELVAAIENEMTDFAYYLSNYLTHPRYGGERQVGFARGESLRPYALKEVEPGEFAFRIQGVAVGRRDLFKFLDGPNRAGPPPPPMRKPPYMSLRAFFAMPTRPTAAEVDQTEWYDFDPRTWARRHPRIPLRPPIPVLFHRARPQPHLAPRYDELYADGLIKIALLFGYDEETHLTSADAREMWKILTAPRGRRFTAKDTGPHGYHGPGLGFSNPTAGNYRQLDFDGQNAFVRDEGYGAGPVRVHYRLAARPLRVGDDGAAEGTVLVGGRPASAGTTLPVGTVVTRKLRAEVRLYNFDKSSGGASSKKLIERFVSVFKDNDVVHYDGHANYGGGFFIGDQPNDILWSSDIGAYRRFFSRDYQIFSIGACHAAGYFADLFYNELRPRKSPRNFDILAAINETAFDDAVHQSMDFVRAMLQDLPWDGAEPPDYDRIVRDMSARNSFRAFIGVFASGLKTRRRR